MLFGGKFQADNGRVAGNAPTFFCQKSQPILFCRLGKTSRQFNRQTQGQ
jgi:hypothetical protein